jgi:hypothetical protein
MDTPGDLIPNAQFTRNYCVLATFFDTLECSVQRGKHPRAARSRYCASLSPSHPFDNSRGGTQIVAMHSSNTNYLQEMQF